MLHALFISLTVLTDLQQVQRFLPLWWQFFLIPSTTNKFANFRTSAWIESKGNIFYTFKPKILKKKLRDVFSPF